MRVLHVIESLGRGGAEQALVNVLPAMAAAGHHCEVAALWAPYDLAPDLEAAGVRVHRLGLTHRWNLAQGVPRVLAACRRSGPDVVHAHLFFAMLYAALTRPLSPRPRRVVTFHNLGFDSYPADTPWRRARKRLEAWLTRHAMDGHLAVSGAVARHYRRHLGLGPVTVVPNACPVEGVQAEGAGGDRGVLAAFGLAPDAFVLLCCGRLVPEKGHRHLLESLAVLRAEGLRPQVLVVGDGPQRAHVAAAVEAGGLAGQVVVHPAVPHDRLMELMAAADAVVIPSTQEGFPLTPGEALALGRPVVATAVGGIPELMEDGDSRLLVPPADPGALARAIALLMRDPALGARLGEAGPRRVAPYRPEAVAADLAGFYARLSTGGTAAGRRAEAREPAPAATDRSTSR